VRIQVDETTLSAQGNHVEEILYPNLNSTYVTYSGGSVQGQPRKVVDGDGVVTQFEYDARGRLDATIRGDVRTEYDFDVWGRLTRVVENASPQSQVPAAVFTFEQGPDFKTYRVQTASAGVIEMRRHYDRWGNLAVQLHNNVASDGQPPHRHGATSTARPWIRTENLWQHSLLVERRVDRRPLDEGAGAPLQNAADALMQVTQYEYSPAGVLQAVRNPNGSASLYTFDGYGSLYQVRIRKTASDPQSETIAVGRWFVNEYLESIRVVQGEAPDLLTTLLERNAAGAVTAVVEPSFQVPTGYTGATSGARHEFGLDQLGRTISVRVVDPTLPQGQGDLARRTLAYDQLDRTIRIADDVLGFGTGSQVTVNR
jgi:YD repeat-containing protein